MKKINEAINSFKDILEEEKITVEEKVEETISREVTELLLDIASDIGSCESPIEKMFAILLRSAVNRSDLSTSQNYFDFLTQHEVTLYEGTRKEVSYRLDFLIQFTNFKSGKDYDFAIECDGHEFHEKTKEQARKDKKRDRDLLISGIVPIRFTGSEIYKNAFRCANEAVRIIEKYITEMYRFN